MSEINDRFDHDDSGRDFTEEFTAKFRFPIEHTVKIGFYDDGTCELVDFYLDLDGESLMFAIDKEQQNHLLNEAINQYKSQ